MPPISSIAANAAEQKEQESASSAKKRLEEEAKEAAKALYADVQNRVSSSSSSTGQYTTSQPGGTGIPSNIAVNLGLTGQRQQGAYSPQRPEGTPLSQTPLSQTPLATSMSNLLSGVQVEGVQRHFRPRKSLKMSRARK